MVIVKQIIARSIGRKTNNPSFISKEIGAGFATNVMTKILKIISSIKAWRKEKRSLWAVGEAKDPRWGCYPWNG